MQKTGLKEGYVISHGNLEYNDEIHYTEGYNLPGAQLYATEEEAVEAATQQVRNDFGGCSVEMFWYNGDEPPDVMNYQMDIINGAFEDPYPTDMWNNGASINGFIDWCVEKGIDWNANLGLYAITKVTFN